MLTLTLLMLLTMQAQTYTADERRAFEAVLASHMAHVDITRIKVVRTAGKVMCDGEPKDGCFKALTAEFPDAPNVPQEYRGKSVRIGVLTYRIDCDRAIGDSRDCVASRRELLEHEFEHAVLWITGDLGWRLGEK